MNTLEQLVCEYLMLGGYWTRVNLTGEREIDCLGFHPTTRELIHIECTQSDKSSLASDYEKKFANAESVYKEINPTAVTKIAIFGAGKKANPTSKDRLARSNILLWSRKEFIAKVLDCIDSRPENACAIANTMPLLRALQYAIHLGGLKRP